MYCLFQLILFVFAASFLSVLHGVRFLLLLFGWLIGCGGPVVLSITVMASLLAIIRASMLIGDALRIFVAATVAAVSLDIPLLWGVTIGSC